MPTLAPTARPALLCSRQPRRRTLFISGTASILNAESYHLGDVLKQAQLSCQNLQRVMEQAQRTNWGTFRLQPAKIYLRHGADHANLQLCFTRLAGA